MVRHYNLSNFYSENYFGRLSVSFVNFEHEISLKMEETRRQKQIARLIKEAMSDIFLKEGKEITENALVTVSQVKMTPDLFTARIYFSIYNAERPEEIMHFIEANNKQLRGLLGRRIGKNMRRVPELVFFKDDTLDEVFKLEQLFKEMKKDNKSDDSTES
jgi:ribosome-binding factor A